MKLKCIMELLRYSLRQNLYIHHVHIICDTLPLRTSTILRTNGLSKFQITMPNTSRLTYWPLKLQAHELVHLRTKFIRKLIKDIAAKSRDHSSHCLFIVNSPLLKVKQLIFTNFGRTGFMFNSCCWIFHLQKNCNFFSKSITASFWTLQTWKKGRK